MKNSLVILSSALLLLTSCAKKIDSVVKDITQQQAPPAQTNEFVKYTINEGQQYCDKNGYQQVQISQSSFKVKFDSSAIYKTVAAANQKDVNKLFGFSDNNAQHHEYSARFGWRWSDNALRLFAYTYNNSVLSVKELGTVDIGKENDCSIQVSGENYIFTLNGRTETMSRLSTTPTAVGYKLYPYFGGDETAPHNIAIWIKEL